MTELFRQRDDNALRAADLGESIHILILHHLANEFSPNRLGRVVLLQLEPPVSVRGPHHCDVASGAIEPDDAVDPRSLDGRLALQLQTKLGKERLRSLKVVD